jgi:hypothetical protein
MLPKKAIPQRMVVHTSDIKNITGYGDRAARKIMCKIKNAFGKTKDQFITIYEFCEVTGIKEEIVREQLDRA